MPAIAVLETRVRELAKHFLDDQIADETSPSFAPDLYAIAAFRLLVHAEIEEWLEKTARNEIKSLSTLISGKLQIRSLYRLVLLSILFSVEIPLLVPLDEAALREKLTQTLKKAEDFLNGNNGIKSQSFCKIAMICGAPPDEIDPVLTDALDKYGKSRGDVAHKSIKSVQNLMGPSAEKTEAMSLLAGLQIFFISLRPI